MSTVNQLGTARLLDPSNKALDGQARVNAEILTAVEILGRKLERVEDERDRLARRLALIESAATVDEKTGKLYLPVVMDQNGMPHKEYATPKWMVAASLMTAAARRGAGDGVAAGGGGGGVHEAVVVGGSVQVGDVLLGGDEGELGMHG